MQLRNLFVLGVLGVVVFDIGQLLRAKGGSGIVHEQARAGQVVQSHEYPNVEVGILNLSAVGPLFSEGYVAVTTYQDDNHVVMLVHAMFPDVVSAPEVQLFVRLLEPRTLWTECSLFGTGTWTFSSHCRLPKAQFYSWMHKRLSRPTFELFFPNTVPVVRRVWFFEITHEAVESTLSFREKNKLAPRVALSICSFVRREGWFLVEWLEWHLSAGFRDIHLYFHEMDEFDFKIVQAYVARGLITVDVLPKIVLKLHHGYWQTLAMSHCFGKYNGTASWVAVIDTDEFLVSPWKSNRTAVEGFESLLIGDSEPSAFRIQQVGFSHESIGPFHPDVSTFRRYREHSVPAGWGGHKTMSRMENVESYAIHHPGALRGHYKIADAKFIFLAHFFSRCTNRDTQKGFTKSTASDLDVIHFASSLENRLRVFREKFLGQSRILNKCEQKLSYYS
jgi:hypothetical protein